VAAWAKLRGEIDANLAIPIPALLVPKTNKFIFLSFIKALFELPMPKRSYNNYSYSRSFQAWKLTYRPDSTSYEGSPGEHYPNLPDWLGNAPIVRTPRSRQLCIWLNWMPPVTKFELSVCDALHIRVVSHLQHCDCGNRCPSLERRKRCRRS
jgi:hypothetical protein